jgi:phage head maturation protease
VSGAQYLQGFACLYDVIHHFRGGRDIFQRGCFTDSLKRFNDVMYGVDHRYEKPKLGRQEDGTLHLHDTEIGLAFRLALKPGHLELLAGRDQVSVACIPYEIEFRDGIRIIKEASIFEISSVFVGAMTTTHAVVVDADKVGPLAQDSKNFSYHGAAQKFTNALKRLEHS